MRLARVLLAESKAPRIALERDGALYDVETLEARFATRFAPDGFALAGDFRTRAVALRRRGPRCARRAARARRATNRGAPFARTRSSALALCDPPSARCSCRSRAAATTASPAIESASRAASPACSRRSPSARASRGPRRASMSSRCSAKSLRCARDGGRGRDRRLRDRQRLDLARRARAPRAAKAGDGAVAPCARRRWGPVLVDRRRATRDLASRRAAMRIDGRSVFEGALGLELATTLAAAIARFSQVVDLRAGGSRQRRPPRALARSPRSARWSSSRSKASASSSVAPRDATLRTTR